MKLVNILLVTLVLAIACSGIAMAGSSFKMIQQTTVSAQIKNNHWYDVRAAVRMTAFDDTGNVAGHLCREVELNRKDVTLVSYLWQAPAMKPSSTGQLKSMWEERAPVANLTVTMITMTTTIIIDVIRKKIFQK